MNSSDHPNVGFQGVERKCREAGATDADDPQQTSPRDRSCFLPELHSARSFSLLEFRPLRNSKGGTTMKIGRALLLAGVAVAALTNWPAWAQQQKQPNCRHPLSLSPQSLQYRCSRPAGKPACSI